MFQIKYCLFIVGNLPMLKFYKVIFESFITLAGSQTDNENTGGAL